MALDPQYIALFPIQEQIWDKTLNIPLAAGTVHFYSDTNFSVPKDVYQLVIDGLGNATYVNLGPVLTLSGIGTYVDNSGTNIIPYLWPYTGLPTDVPVSMTVELYYIRVLDVNGGEQFDIAAWPPQLQGGGVEPINEADTTGNIIQNGQFVNVLFNPTATYASPVVFSTTGTLTSTPIAPGWDMITTGTGSFSVYQQAITDMTAPGNPAYALGIATSTGYSQPLILRQRIYAPRIFSGALVSGTFIAETYASGGPNTLTMSYVPSGTMTPQIICTGATPITGFGTIFNSTAVTITAGAAGAAPLAYVDITITIPVNAQVQISNIQLCGVSNSTEIVNYLQNTPAEEVNGLFYYYQPQLNYKPIPSYLTGWDFPLNPFQLGPTVGPNTLGGTNLSQYVTDQTILFSSVDNTLSSAIDSNTKGLKIVNGTTTSAFAVIQYLSLAQAREILSQRNSISLKAFLSNGSGSLSGTVSLWWTTNAIPNIKPTHCFSLVSSVNSSGVPTVGGGGNYGTWNQVPNNFNTTTNLGNFTLTTTDTEFHFNGFDATGVTSPSVPATNATAFAIVLAFAPMTTTQTVTIDYCSLVGGDIPTRPAPQTPDEVLRECQYYYEKSYNTGVAAGSTPVAGFLTVFQNSETSTANNVSAFLYQDVIDIRFKQVKKDASYLVSIYAYDGTLGSISGVLNGLDTASNVKSATGNIVLANYWTDFQSSDSSISYTPSSAQLGANLLTITPASGAAFKGTTAWVYFHYVIDDRLGVV